ncbi:MAG: choice-of-anchor H family protein [Pseudomonadota bacterium]
MKALSKGSLLAIALMASAISAASETRDVSSRQGLVSEKGNSDIVAEYKSSGDGVTVKGNGGDKLSRKAPNRDASQSLNQDFWIFDARADIFDDFDADGFFTRLELTFDADTVFNSADVYAVLYLSLEGGDWIEYGATNTFRINGSSGNDEYFFDSDLVSGFPTGYYDVLIDLYDDFDGSLVASFGPAESAELFDLPLESQNLDSVAPPVVVVSNEGGGGSAGLGLLAMLGGLAALRRRSSA